MELLFIGITWIVGSICCCFISVKFNNGQNQQSKFHYCHLVIYKTKYFWKFWFQKKCYEFVLNNNLGNII